MQRFQFRLERVLEWRRKKCQMEESRLAVCLDLVHATQRQIERLRAERASIDRELLDRPAIPAADFLNLGHYRLRADQEATELAKELEQRVLSASEQRARVLKAQRAVKLLEKMRERRIEEYAILAGRELEQVAGEAYLALWPRAHRAH
jgi:flagellar export protein FliJ